MRTVVFILFTVLAAATSSAQEPKKVDPKVLERVGKIADADLETALTIYGALVRGQMVKSVVAMAEADMAYIKTTLEERKLPPKQEKEILFLIERVKSSAAKEDFMYDLIMDDLAKGYAKEGKEALDGFKKNLVKVNADFGQAFHDRVLEARKLGWKVPPRKEDKE